jgi:lipid A 4'-phosphatase
MRLKTRHQEHLALAVMAALATAVFEIWPRLDLAVSGYFFDGTAFVGHQWGWAQLLYLGVPPLGTWLVALALVMAVLPWLGGWGRRLVQPWLHRRAIASLLMVLLGVGLVVHTALKDSWGRPRPVHVQAFGGPKVYQAPLQHSTQCDRNCSFVSGHAAAGFALMALGLFGSRRTRRRWWAIGMVAGSAIGLSRVAQGGHFFSDIVFCLLALWLVCVLLRGMWLRLALLRRQGRQRRLRKQA